MKLVKAVLAALSASLITITPSVAVDVYPSKAPRIIISYAPGGSSDIIARFLGTELSQRWNKQVVVENKPGAGGMIGAGQVARSEPDGYTLLIAYTPEVSINKLIYKDMPYDPISDFTPIARIATSPLVLVSGPKLGINSFAELLKKKDLRMSFGSAGTGGQQHMAGELLRMETGLDLIHAPYRGSGPAVADLLGGHIDVLFAGIAPVLSQVQGGTLQALLVSGDERQSQLPGVPTAKELGVSGLDLPAWWGVFGPKGMDAKLVDKISQDVAAILSDPEKSKAFTKIGANPAYLSSPEFQTFIGAEMDKYGHIVKESGIEKQ